MPLTAARYDSLGPGCAGERTGQEGRNTGRQLPQVAKALGRNRHGLQSPCPTPCDSKKASGLALSLPRQTAGLPGASTDQSARLHPFSLPGTAGSMGSWKSLPGPGPLQGSALHPPHPPQSRLAVAMSDRRGFGRARLRGNSVGHLLQHQCHVPCQPTQHPGEAWCIPEGSLMGALQGWGHWALPTGSALLSRSVLSPGFCPRTGLSSPSAEVSLGIGDSSSARATGEQGP